MLDGFFSGPDGISQLLFQSLDLLLIVKVDLFGKVADELGL